MRKKFKTGPNGSRRGACRGAYPARKIFGVEKGRSPRKGVFREQRLGLAK